MSISAARVVVTDYNFPDVERERAAAQELGADFASFQCKTAEEVAEAVEGAGRFAAGAGRRGASAGRSVGRDAGQLPLLMVLPEPRLSTLGSPSL